MFGALAIVRKTVQPTWYRSDCTLPLRSILVLRLAEKPCGWLQCRLAGGIVRRFTGFTVFSDIFKEASTATLHYYLFTTVLYPHSVIFAVACS